MFILPFTYRNPNLATCYFTLLQPHELLFDDIDLPWLHAPQIDNVQRPM